MRDGMPGRSLLPRRPNDRQNYVTTSGSLKMSVNVCDADPKTAGSTKTRYPLVAVFLTVLLSGAEISFGAEDGPMATAPLPPPVQAAPPATGLQQPQDATPSPASRHVLPQSHPRTGRGMQLAHLHKRNNDRHHVDHSTRAALSEKRFGQHVVGDAEREQVYTVPPVASTMMPPLALLPLPFGYIPAGPPAYGYALVYPPPWPLGSALSH